MEEKELFEDYEMKVWEFNPRIYKVFAIAALINILGIFSLSQFNVFSTRGCDTPYVGIVCQVLDSAYVASTFLGQDNEWTSKPYTKEEIGDAEEITYIDVSDQLKYPDGYFALANPEVPADQAVPNIMDGFNPPTDSSSTPSSGGDLTNQPQVIPTPNDKVAKQDVPDSPFSFGDSPKQYKPPTVARNKTPKPIKSNNNPMSNDSPGDLTLPGDKTTAGKNTKPSPTPKKTEPTPSPTVDPEGAKTEFTSTFNKKPFQDLVDGVIAKVDDKDPKVKVDLKQTFTVVLDGVLTKEGKFDAKKTRFVKGEGQEQMVGVAKDAIEAIGNSSIFSYLQALGVEKINLTLVQDDQQISAIINSNLPTETKARTVSSGFNGLMAVAKINVKEPEVQDLMKALKFQPQGKSFIINFAMPKDQAHKIIDQKIQEARQKKSQPSSSDDSKESATGKGR